MRVLIVDDSRTARMMLKRVLPPALGSDVVEASGGQEAIRCVQTGGIDLMFLDLTMPDVDGYQVLETLKNEGRESPKVIVMSADVQPEARARIERLGALGFLPKPASQAAVETLLREHGIL